MGRFKPVGSTDSEHIFCWLLHEIELAFPEPPVDPKPLYDLIYRHLGKLHAQGVCNVLLTDGSVLIAYCSNRLQWITRRAPFGSALLKDIELEVDFATETTVNDVVTVIATQALTTNETWESFEPNELMVFEQGELNYQVKATD